MTRHDPDTQAWVDEARHMPIVRELARRGIVVKKSDNGMPCPGCGGVDRFAVNLTKNVWNCRASGASGDAIALVQHIEGCDFKTAVEIVTGRPAPRHEGESEAERLARHERLAREAEARRIEDEAKAKAQSEFREAERKRMFGVWQSAVPAKGTLVEDYLTLRGLFLPASGWLKFIANYALWDRPGGTVVHRGPAMLAQIQGPDGRFAGLHCTWLDMGQPKGKALIADADGQMVAAKKVRGSQKGGSILLAKHWSGPLTGPRVLFLGEGIETVLAVWCELTELRSKWLEASEFRASVNLGNIGRRAVANVPHPTETYEDAKGKVRRRLIPNDEPKPDDDWPLIPIADSVETLILLGDGDSEPVRTRNAMLRGAKSYAALRPDLDIRLAMAGEGVDFNDLRRARA